LLWLPKGTGLLKIVLSASSRLVDGLPEEGFTPRLADAYWALWYAKMKRSETGWVVKYPR
jgi:hypothetical protein